MGEHNRRSDLGDYIRLARVLEVYPAKYTAKVQYLSSPDGEFDTTPECRIMSLKLSMFGDMSVNLPSPEDRVYVSVQRSLNHPEIIGYPSDVSEAPSKFEYQHQITPTTMYGATDPLLGGGTLNFRSVGAPDVLPGDQVSQSEAGSIMGLLRGGSAILKASPLAQIIASKFRGTVTIVSRRLKIFTDFGEILSTSEDGNASLRIRGNTDVKKSNKHTGDYDYDVALGGKNLFSAKLKDSFWAVVDGDGKLRLKAKTVQVLLETPPDIRIMGDSFQRNEGSKTTEITVDNTTLVKKNNKITVRGKSTQLIRGSYTQTVGGHVRKTCNATVSEVIKGISPLSLDPIAKNVRIGAGDYVIDIGNPSLGGTPAPILGPTLGSYKVNLLAGDYSVSSIVGNIDMSTLFGTATVSGTLKASLASQAISELNANICALEGTISMLAGVSGSTDPVVTALRLFQEVNNKIIMVFNTHMHMVPQAPGGTLPSAPPSGGMQPLDPTAIGNKDVLA